MALVFVFLILAAQYESWSLPLSVMLGTPIAVFGAIGGLFLARLFSESYVNNVFAQIGLVMLIGMSAKNAILIVEFAKSYVEQGMELVEATMQAVRDRLRPILMTSLAFILGVLPLAVSTGAGANSRHAIGTGVMGGMIGATVLGLFFVPIFFVVVRRLLGDKSR